MGGLLKRGFFGLLAQLNTSRRLWKGWLPSLLTLSSLLVFSSVFALVTSFTSFISATLLTTGTILALGFLNYFFQSTIYIVNNGAAEVYSTEFFVEEGFSLHKMVEHLVAEINAHYGTQDSSHPDHMSMPTILMFKNTDFKIESVPGRYSGNSLLCFSSGSVNLSYYNLSYREFAALTMLELHKIRNKTGLKNTFVAMGVELVETLEQFKTSNKFLFRTLGFLAGPLQFFTLYQKSILRSQHYVSGEVVVKCGRGRDLYEGSNHLSCPVRLKRLSRENAQNAIYERYGENTNPFVRAPYNREFERWIEQKAPWLQRFSIIWQLIDWPFKRLADWVDAHESVGSDKSSYRWANFLDICVREVGFFVKECFSIKPRGPNFKAHIKEEMKQFEEMLKQQRSYRRRSNRDPKAILQPYHKVPEDSRCDFIALDKESKNPPYSCQVDNERSQPVLNAFESSRRKKVLRQSRGQRDASQELADRKSSFISLVAL